jgi:repressor LexA
VPVIKTLTTKQQETIQFIRKFRAENKQSPTVTELSNGLNLKSLRSVTQRLELLEKKGLIKRDPFKHRSIVLLENMNPMHPFGTTRIPVIASAGCDAGDVYAQEKYDEYISVDNKFIDNKDVVAIKAVGNSMVDAHINNGDYVLTQVTNNVSNGDRVVAVIGDMAVIKRFSRVPGAIILEPESKGNGYQPIIMRDNFKIFGKVLNVISGSYSNKDDVDFIYEPGYRKGI